MSNSIVLDVKNLSIIFDSGGDRVSAVSEVSFTLRRGETLAVVGESGSGKSVTSLALMGLLPRDGGCDVRGVINFTSSAGSVQNLLANTKEEMRRVRGRHIAMVFQEPMTSLNPVKTIGSQIIESVRYHHGMDGEVARDEACRLLDLVGISSPRERLAVYPHQMSGGMRQRVMIAMALAGDPSILIADEPTTALDVTIQAQILDLIRRLQKKTGMAVIFVTHNLGVVAEIADRVVVMYCGRVVEEADVGPLFLRPLMPYTSGLLRSVPRLDLAGQRKDPLPAIRGTVPEPGDMTPGCAFAPRCDDNQPGLCDRSSPVLEAAGDARLVRCLRWNELMARMGY